MKNLLLILLLLTFSQVGKTQNLIPDSGIEQNTSGHCPAAYVAIDYAPYWYRAAGTVDLYVGMCIYNDDLSPTINPWTFGNYPNSSNSFIGIWGAYNTDFTRTTEIAGTSLLSPLVENQFYYFSIETRYRGKYHPKPTIFPADCVTESPRSLEIFISQDEDLLQTFTDPNAAATGVIGENVLSLTSSALMDTIITDEWSELTGCFQANGGEKQLGIGLTIDSFEPIYPCDTNRYSEDWFSMYYYNIDNIVLIPYPLPQTDTLLLCIEDKTVSFDLASYFDWRTLEDVQFVWEDGMQGSTRTFRNLGTYRANAILDCGSIPFEIYIQEEKCEAIALVPDAFTPNFDGNNDELFPFFVAEFPIVNYEFMVFDRWGNLFYQSDEYDGFTGWDGTANGKAAQNGVYVWSLKFDLLAPDETKFYQLSGDVLLIR